MLAAVRECVYALDWERTAACSGIKFGMKEMHRPKLMHTEAVSSKVAIKIQFGFNI